MGENRSLDEFGPASDDADGETSRDDVEPGDAGETAVDDDERTEGTAADESDESMAADESDEPAADAGLPRATYRWSPDGDDCPACGERVERRWRDGDRFVCADCKEW